MVQYKKRYLLFIIILVFVCLEKIEAAQKYWIEISESYGLLKCPDGDGWDLVTIDEQWSRFTFLWKVSPNLSYSFDDADFSAYTVRGDHYFIWYYASSDTEGKSELKRGEFKSRCEWEAKLKELGVMVLTNVDSYFCEKNIIAGHAAVGYFYVFEPQIPIGYYSSPLINIFDSEETWKSKLEYLGASSEFLLLRPEEVRTSKTEQELQPWLYIKMKRFLGLSDLSWQWIFFLFPLLISVMLGMYNIHCGFMSAKILAIILGLISGISQMLLLVDLDIICGPFFYAVVMYPAICFYCTKLGRIIYNKRKVHLITESIRQEDDQFRTLPPNEDLKALLEHFKDDHEGK